MGEKGIGRLAIASIGKQVLIVTKAKNQEEVTAALINWQIFELPGLNLEDIVIPIRTLTELPNKLIIDSMKEELIESLDKLLAQDDITDAEYMNIGSTIKAFNAVPSDLHHKLNRSNDLTDYQSSGTYFFVSPVDETLKFDLDGSSVGKEATKIEKMLMGFHNTMTPDHPKPILDIVFRDYRVNDGTYVDVIDKEQFFTVDDFEVADHHFKGHFDEFGQFKGTIKVYQEKTYEHIVNWTGNNFNKTSCGPFEINLAYVQGKKTQTILNNEDFARISAKADKFGGLYVYKDNIRILPYGNSDVDYLDVEKRRSKHGRLFKYRQKLNLAFSTVFCILDLNKYTNDQYR